MAGGERTVKIKFDGDQKGLDRAAQQGEASVSKWSKGLKKSGELAGKAMAVAGVAIGAALAVGITGGLEKGRADAKVAAQIGATPDLAKRFGTISGKVYGENFGENIGDIDNALKSVWQNNLVSDDATDAEIKSITEKVLTMGTVMEEDTDRVSGAISQMLRTGVAKTAEEAFDVLQRGVEQGNNKAQDLLDTFNEYSTQFRKLGLDGTTSMGLISQAIRAGARDSDTAADALKEFSIRAIDGSKSTVAGFKALGLNAGAMGKQIASGGAGATKGLDTVLDRLRAMKDPVKRNAIAVQLFGTKAEDLGDALFAMDPSEAVGALGKVGGAADRAGKTLSESAGAKLDGFKRKVQQALIDKLAAAVPYIEKTFGFLAKHKNVVIPLAVALGTFAAVVYTITQAMKAWAAIQAILNLALWTSPITWIVLGIVALIAVIVIIATKTTWFQTAWKVAWGAIKTAAQAVWDFLKMLGAWFAGPFVGFFVGAWNKIKGAVQAFWNFLKGLGSWIINTYVGIYVGAWHKIASAFTTAWNGIKSGVTAAKNWIVGKFNDLVTFIHGLPGRIHNAAAGMFNGVRDAFKSALNWIIGKWNKLTFRVLSFNTHIPGVPTTPGFAIPTSDIGYLAKGGPALANHDYVVGERGPEILRMGNSSGSVVPNNALSGDTIVYVTIDGQQLQGRIDKTVREHDRDIRRRVTAGARGL